ncbi:hypothetical protein CBR_g4357 [Chara braunii]|uniref:Uncharacterized protein n=1 Tax=Chara braunii TaxID=69332 RepID=A0A388KHK0_CHABU|nr:hypothetical protein CBR_g4357 [Chara braunii]|eukprot:GBG69521.1 hypothetical protein CBR_g4357 [Chara braunii]
MLRQQLSNSFHEKEDPAFSSLSSSLLTWIVLRVGGIRDASSRISILRGNISKYVAKGKSFVSWQVAIHKLSKGKSFVAKGRASWRREELRGEGQERCGEGQELRGEGQELHKLHVRYQLVSADP